jgi:Sec-independent protein translocase protein TatA
MLKKIGSWIGSIKKYFNELQSEVSLYEHENDKENNLNKNKARDTKDEK